MSDSSTKKKVRYFVGTCDEVVMDTFASSATEAAEEFVEHMGWDYDPNHYDGWTIWVVPVSACTELTLTAQSRYTLEKAKS